jgi:uncharacterized protein (TIGR03435 family)
MPSHGLSKCSAGLLLFLLPAIPFAAEANAKASVRLQATPMDYTGPWQGTTQGVRIQLRITQATPGSYGAVLYNADHAGPPLPANEFLLLGPDVEFAIGSINVRFQGKLDKTGTHVTGTWTQNGKSQPITLEHVKEAAAWEIPKPQRRNPAASKNGEARYEVATVKPAIVGTMGSGMLVHGRQLEARNMSVIDMIEFAYEIQKTQLANAPDWLTTDKFDITMLYDGDQYPNDPECKAMVREVLAERFGLKLHREDKEQSVYALVLAKGGTKLTDSQGDPDGLPGLNLRAPGVLAASNATMADLAGTLQRVALNKPVIDRTQLQGRYDFGLKWTPDDTTAKATGDDIAPGLFTAIQQQLGLKLEATKASASMLVIETAVHPSAN